VYERERQRGDRERVSFLKEREKKEKDRKRE
jgi:hypothetical protein